MNAFEFSSPLIEALGWTLFHSLWQGALIMLLLAGILGLIPTRLAHLRYTFAVFGLVAMVGWAAFTFSQHYFAEEGATVWVNQSDLDFIQAQDAFIVTPFTYVSNETESSTFSSLWAEFSLWLQTYTTEIAFIWLFGVIFFSLKWLGGLFLIFKLKRQAHIIRSGPWAKRLTELSKELGIKRLIRLGETSQVTTPMVVGWLKPIILIPSGMLTGLSADQIEAIFIHELAHIRRHDYLINLLVSLGEVVFFYHPAYWWISKSIRTEREHCCDDLAISICANPISYARALTELAQQQAKTPGLAMAFSGNRHSLKFRIQRLFSNPKPTTFQAGRALVAMLLLLGIWTVSFGNLWQDNPNEWENDAMVDGIENILADATDPEAVYEEKVKAYSQQIEDYHDAVRLYNKAVIASNIPQEIKVDKEQIAVLERLTKVAGAAVEIQDNGAVIIHRIPQKADLLNFFKQDVVVVDSPPIPPMPPMPAMRAMPPMPAMPAMPPMPAMPEILSELPEMLNDILGDDYNYRYEIDEDDLTPKQRRALRDMERSLEEAFEGWEYKMERWGDRYEDRVEDWERSDLRDWERKMEVFGEEFGEEFGKQFGEAYSRQWEDWGKQMEAYGKQMEKYGKSMEKSFDHGEWKYDYDKDDWKEHKDHWKENKDHWKEYKDHWKEEKDHWKEDKDEWKDRRKYYRDYKKSDRDGYNYDFRFNFEHSDNDRANDRRREAERERLTEERRRQLEEGIREKMEIARERQERMREQQERAHEQLERAREQQERAREQQERAREQIERAREQRERERERREHIRDRERDSRERYFDRRDERNDRRRYYRDNDRNRYEEDSEMARARKLYDELRNEVDRYYDKDDEQAETLMKIEGEFENGVGINNFRAIKRAMIRDGIIDEDDDNDLSFRIKNDRIVWIKVNGERLSDRYIDKYQRIMNDD